MTPRDAIDRTPNSAWWLACAALPWIVDLAWSFAQRALDELGRKPQP